MCNWSAETSPSWESPEYLGRFKINLDRPFRWKCSLPSLHQKALSFLPVLFLLWVVVKWWWKTAWGQVQKERTCDRLDILENSCKQHEQRCAQRGVFSEVRGKLTGCCSPNPTEASVANLKMLSNMQLWGKQGSIHFVKMSETVYSQWSHYNKCLPWAIAKLLFAFSIWAIFCFLWCLLSWNVPRTCNVQKIKLAIPRGSE